MLEIISVGLVISMDFLAQLGLHLGPFRVGHQLKDNNVDCITDYCWAKLKVSPDVQVLAQFIFGPGLQLFDD